MYSTRLRKHKAPGGPNTPGRTLRMFCDVAQQLVNKSSDNTAKSTNKRDSAIESSPLRDILKAADYLQSPGHERTIDLPIDLPSPPLSPLPQPQPDCDFKTSYSPRELNLVSCSTSEEINTNHNETNCAEDAEKSNVSYRDDKAPSAPLNTSRNEMNNAIDVAVTRLNQNCKASNCPSENRFRMHKEDDKFPIQEATEKVVTKNEERVHSSKHKKRKQPDEEKALLSVPRAKWVVEDGVSGYNVVVSILADMGLELVMEDQLIELAVMRVEEIEEYMKEKKLLVRSHDVIHKKKEKKGKKGKTEKKDKKRKRSKKEESSDSDASDR